MEQKNIVFEIPGTNPTPESQWVVSTGLADKVREDSTSILATPATLEKGTILPVPYFIVNSDGVFIELNEQYSPSALKDYLDRQVFRVEKWMDADNKECLHPNMYLKNLDIKVLLDALYPSVEIEGEDAISANKQNTQVKRLKIADSIHPFDFRGLKQFRDANFKLNRSSDGIANKAVYRFEEHWAEVPDPDRPGKDLWAKEDLDKDLFIAMLWIKGVKYGFNSSNINEGILKQKGDFTVAECLLPEEGKPWYLERSNALHARKNVKWWEWSGKVQLNVIEAAAPYVSSGTVLATQFPSIPGKPGRGIDGFEIPPKSLPEVDLLTPIRGSNTRIEMMAFGNCVLVAWMDGYVNIDKRSKMISVDKTAHIENISTSEIGWWVVTSSTDSSVGLSAKFISEHAHAPYINCYHDIDLKGHSEAALIKLTEWVVATKWDVRVWWAIRGRSHIMAIEGDIIVGQEFDFKEFRMSEPDSAGTILDGPVLRAPKWKIKFSYASNSFLLGKHIEGDIAAWCVIIAETVNLKEAKDCHIICLKSAQIDMMLSGRIGAWVLVRILASQEDSQKRLDEITKEIESLKLAIDEAERVLTPEEIKWFQENKNHYVNLQRQVQAIRDKISKKIPVLKTEVQTVQEFSPMKQRMDKILPAWKIVKEERPKLAFLEKIQAEISSLLQSTSDATIHIKRAWVGAEVYDVRYTFSDLIEPLEKIPTGKRIPYLGPNVVNLDDGGLDMSPVETAYASKQEHKGDWENFIRFIPKTLRLPESTSYVVNTNSSK